MFASSYRWPTQERNQEQLPSQVGKCIPYIDKPANNLSSSESGDPFNFLIRNAHPEESGWYWCSSGDFESGQHVAVLVPTPLPTSATTTSTPSSHSLHVDLSTTQESAPEQMGPLKVYNRFEAKWTERQVNEHYENSIKKCSSGSKDRDLPGGGGDPCAPPLFHPQAAGGPLPEARQAGEESSKYVETSLICNLRALFSVNLYLQIHVTSHIGCHLRFLYDTLLSL